MDIYYLSLLSLSVPEIMVRFIENQQFIVSDLCELHVKLESMCSVRRLASFKSIY